MRGRWWPLVAECAHGHGHCHRLRTRRGCCRRRPRRPPRGCDYGRGHVRASCPHRRGAAAGTGSRTRESRVTGGGTGSSGPGSRSPRTGAGTAVEQITGGFRWWCRWRGF